MYDLTSTFCLSTTVGFTSQWYLPLWYTSVIAQNILILVTYSNLFYSLIMEISLNNLACIYLWLKHRQGKLYTFISVWRLWTYCRMSEEPDKDIYFSSSRGNPTNKLCKYTAPRTNFIRTVLAFYAQLPTFSCSLLNFPRTMDINYKVLSSSLKCCHSKSYKDC
jgi:hypothetical protein